MRRHRLLWLSLRNFYEFPDYAKMIKAQASSEAFVVSKDSISRTLNFSSHKNRNKVFVKRRHN